MYALMITTYLPYLQCVQSSIPIVFKEIAGGFKTKVGMFYIKIKLIKYYV